MQIKRITQVGTLADSSHAPAPQPPARPQPEGLRPRFKPIGVYDPAISVPTSAVAGAEDTEMTEAPTLATPKESAKKDKKKAEGKAEKEKKTKKAKKTSGEVSEPTIAEPSQSDRKRKHTASEDDAAAAAEQLLKESQSAGKTSKKQKTGRKGSPDLGSEPSSTSRKETPILPPMVPALSQSLASTASIPATASTPVAKKTKAARKSKKDVSTPAPASSMETHPPSTATKPTPVPLPSFPGSSQLRDSPAASSPQIASTPVPTKEKSKKGKSAKGKDKQQTPTPSNGMPKKVTPVPLPNVTAGSG